MLIKTLVFPFKKSIFKVLYLCMEKIHANENQIYKALKCAAGFFFKSSTVSWKIWTTVKPSIIYVKVNGEKYTKYKNYYTIKACLWLEVKGISGDLRSALENYTYIF